MAFAPRIVVVADPAQAAQPALERGLRFAAALNAKLEVFVAVYNQFVEHDERARVSFLERQKQSVEALVESQRGGVEDVVVEARWGRPLADEVIKRTEEIDPLMVVKGTHHHSALKRTLLSTADWDLIRNCAAPLVLAKDRDLSRRPKFLAALDPTNEHEKPRSLDGAILSLAKRLSESLGGSLRPLHVLDSRLLAVAEPLPAVALAPMALPITAKVPPDAIGEAIAERRKLLDELLTAAGIEAGLGTIELGDPSTVLVDFAGSDSTDFLVMGAVSRGLFDRILIGHTAEKILDRLPCDMIVVKPRQ